VCAGSVGIGWFGLKLDISAEKTLPPGFRSAPYDRTSGAVALLDREYRYDCCQGSRGTLFRYGPRQPSTPGSSVSASSPPLTGGYSPQSRRYISRASRIACTCKVAARYRRRFRSDGGCPKRPRQTVNPEIDNPENASRRARGLSAGASRTRMRWTVRARLCATFTLIRRIYSRKR
jgi:hypothetical protein